MERVIPEALNGPIAAAIETVYSYGPLAEKTVILGEFGVAAGICLLIFGTVV
jgi:hypothetical protein